MHELALMEDLVTTVQDRIEEGRVTRVFLDVGRLTCVAPDALRFCFEVCAKDTRLEGATLEINEIPGRARCRACETAFELDRRFLPCACGSFELEMTAGEELTLSQVQVEVA